MLAFRSLLRKSPKPMRSSIPRHEHKRRHSHDLRQRRRHAHRRLRGQLVGYRQCRHSVRRRHPPPAFYFDGRFSNGPIWLDKLGAALGSAVDPALAGGSNFAFGGARVATSPDVPSLQTQANAFLSTTAITGADPNSLYVVYGGVNDVRDALVSADPVAAVTTAAQQVAGIVGDLAEAGAVDIVVPTLVNVGEFAGSPTGG